ncbi:MAG: ion transporter [Bacteroidaceae bacterium]|nr:ion transporter [Bacteroidaceae bacterium]
MTLSTWLEKERLRQLIFDDNTPAGRRFEIVLTVAIAISLLILFTESMSNIPHWLKLTLGGLEILLTLLFTIEYIARLYCAESRKGYALSAWGIIDLLAVLPPYLTFFFPGARYMLIFRSIRFIRIFRIFRLFAFLNEGELLLKAIGRSIHKIAVYFLFVFILVICLGTLMFIIENGHPDSSFSDIWTSIYWAITTLSTVGYGDITPVTPLGRMLSSFIMLLGYTLIAVPGGIVTASFINTTNDPVRDGRCPRCDNKVHKTDKYCSQCGEKL